MEMREMRDMSEILERVDHTLLAVDATWENIRQLCDEGLHYHTASVCIPPCYVKQAKEYVGEKLSICTVIGFPNGYQSTESKVFETQAAVADGADEIDMVIRIGMVKDNRDDEVLDEIRRVRAACPGKILKVIIECCLLTDMEKIRMCRMVSASGADYIKTSTGFSVGGATAEDVALLRRHSDPALRVKAAGGIASLEDAERFLALGADRLGTSRIVKIAKAMEKNEDHL